MFISEWSYNILTWFFATQLSPWNYINHATITLLHKKFRTNSWKEILTYSSNAKSRCFWHTVFLKPQGQIRVILQSKFLRSYPANIYLFKVNNKNTRKTPVTSFWCFYCQLWTYFTPFSGVSLADFEQVHVSWVRS